MGSKYDRFMIVFYCSYIMSLVIIRRMKAFFSSFHCTSSIVAVVTISKSSFALAKEPIRDQITLLKDI